MNGSGFQPTDALLRIIARAAPLHERAHSPCFAPAPEQPRLHERTAAWIKAIAGDATEQLDSILEACGRPDLLAGLHDVVVADPHQLPQWARALVQLMSVDHAETDAVNLYGPFMRLARQELRQLDPHGDLLLQQATEDLLEMLRLRFFPVCSQVINYELLATFPAWSVFGGKSTAPTTMDGTVAAWMRRFELYPALAYSMAVVYTNWQTFTAELLQRLATDRDLLAEQLFAGVSAGPVASVKGDVGDMHNHGRSVAILTFENTSKAVYKPKDLRIAAAYMDLVALLNAKLELPLPVRTILTRDAYAWEEHIAPGDCVSEAQVANFYRRMGMTIRLLQLLEARDFWLDNLIACGENPVFIDLEMLLQPRDRPSRSFTAAEREAQQLIDESMILTGTITMPTVIGLGVSAEDLGALSSKQHFLSPFKSHTDSGSTGASQRDAFRAWEHSEHVPTLHGAPIGVAGFTDQLHAGYRAMHACLCASRERLLAADSPLAAMATFPVRFIHRDTWSYYQIIQWSLSPKRLTDSVRREQFLVQFIRIAYQQHGLDQQALRLAWSEIASIYEGDIPFFQCLPSDSAVLTVENKPITHYFAQTAFERLQNRLHQLDAFQLDQQHDLLSSCLAAANHRPVELANVGMGVASQQVPAWLEVAVELGDFILAQRVGTGEDLAWIGLTYHPFSDMRCVELLQPDVLTGTGGLAILFADLYVASGLPRFRDAARGALAASHRFIADTPAVLRDLSERSTFGSIVPTVCGAFYGLGAHIYVLRRCARLLAMPELDQQALAYLALLPLPELCRLAGNDLVCGTSGLLLATLTGNGTQQPINKRVFALIDQLLRVRVADGTLSPTNYPNPSALSHLPDGTAGLALALARLARQPHTPPYLYDAAGQATLLLRESASIEKQTSGHVLARLGLMQDAATNDSAALAAANRLLETDLAIQSSAALLDGLEIAITAFEASHERWYNHKAQSLAQELWQRRQLHGTWFPECFAADRNNLSVISGVAAVAHGFLRLHNPSDVQSIRLVC